MLGYQKLPYLEKPVLWQQIDTGDRGLDPAPLSIMLIYIYHARPPYRSNALVLEVLPTWRKEVPPHLEVKHLARIERVRYSHVLYGALKFENLSRS